MNRLAAWWHPWCRVWGRPLVSEGVRARGPLRDLVSDTLGGAGGEFTEWLEPAALRRPVEAQPLGWTVSAFLGRLLTLELALRARRQARSARAAPSRLSPALPPES